MDPQLFLSGTLRAPVSDPVKTERTSGRSSLPTRLADATEPSAAGSGDERVRLEAPTFPASCSESRLQVPANSKTPVADHEAILDQISPQYRWLGRRWVRPEVQEKGDEGGRLRSRR